MKKVKPAVDTWLALLGVCENDGQVYRNGEPLFREFDTILHKSGKANLTDVTLNPSGMLGTGIDINSRGVSPIPTNNDNEYNGNILVLVRLMESACKGWSNDFRLATRVVRGLKNAGKVAPSAIAPLGYSKSPLPDILKGDNLLMTVSVDKALHISVDEEVKEYLTGLKEVNIKTTKSLTSFLKAFKQFNVQLELLTDFLKDKDSKAYKQWSKRHIEYTSTDKSIKDLENYIKYMKTNLPPIINKYVKGPILGLDEKVVESVEDTLEDAVTDTVIDAVVLEEPSKKKKKKKKKKKSLYKEEAEVIEVHTPVNKKTSLFGTGNSIFSPAAKEVEKPPVHKKPKRVASKPKPAASAYTQTQTPAASAYVQQQATTSAYTTPAASAYAQQVKPVLYTRPDRNVEGLMFNAYDFKPAVDPGWSFKSLGVTIPAPSAEPLTYFDSLPKDKHDGYDVVWLRVGETNEFIKAVYSPVGVNHTPPQQQQQSAYGQQQPAYGQQPASGPAGLLNKLRGGASYQNTAERLPWH